MTLLQSLAFRKVLPPDLPPVLCRHPAGGNIIGRYTLSPAMESSDFTRKLQRVYTWILPLKIIQNSDNDHFWVNFLLYFYNLELNSIKTQLLHLIKLLDLPSD